MSLVFGSFSESRFVKNLFKSEHYSKEEIEWVKISQNKIRKSANSWKSEEVIKRYKESANELSRINEIYIQIDNNYSRIIKIMEEEKEYLSVEDEMFLEVKESKLPDELIRLRDTVNIRSKISTWQDEIEGIEITQDKYSNFFKNKKSLDGIKLDYSNFDDTSKYIINKDKLIISKLKLNQELSKQEIDYSLNERERKMNELINIFNRINKYIERRSL